MRRLCAAFEDRGPAGLVSGKRRQPSNRRLPGELRSLRGGHPRLRAGSVAGDVRMLGDGRRNIRLPDELASQEAG